MVLVHTGVAMAALRSKTIDAWAAMTVPVARLGRAWPVKLTYPSPWPSWEEVQLGPTVVQSGGRNPALAE